MKFVILGCTGFIGSCLAEHLSGEEGCECVGVSTRGCDLLDAKRTERVLNKICNDRIVVYAAGIPRLKGNTFEDMQNNIRMVFNTTSALMKTTPKRMVFLSSVEVYGVPRELPVTEKTALEPTTLYGLGKITAEMLLRRWHLQTGIPLNILRLPGVYGPNDGGSGFIGALVEAILDKSVFALYGDGSSTRDYIYVHDIPRVVLALANSSVGYSLLNLATGCSLSLNDIMEKAFTLYGRCEVKRIPVEEASHNLEFDISLARAVLKDLEFTTVDDGLKSCLEGMDHGRSRIQQR